MNALLGGLSASALASLEKEVHCFADDYIKYC